MNIGEYSCNSNKQFTVCIFYINIVYFITFKWNIELLQIFIFELVQYTYSVQIQGYTLYCTIIFH